jgi:polyhydroxyalkanoate synthesis regulator phasin
MRFKHLRAGQEFVLEDTRPIWDDYVFTKLEMTRNGVNVAGVSPTQQVVSSLFFDDETVVHLNKKPTATLEERVLKLEQEVRDLRRQLRERGCDH